MEAGQKEKTPISSDLQAVKGYMEKNVGLGVSFDLGVREILIRDTNVQIYYVNGLCDTNYIIEIMQSLADINEFKDIDKNEPDVYELVHNRIVDQSVVAVQTMDEMVDQVLSGLISIIVAGSEKALIVDVRSYPGRQPQEPDTERITRGARDGYVENIIINTALTRRRIRDERLRFEIMRVGERSKTDIAIGYIEGIANPKLVDIVRSELQSIEIDGLTMAEKTVEEYKAYIAEELETMKFGMTVVKHTKSNGIVLVKDNATVGVGPGQTNRITALELAIKYAGDKAKGSVMASDAFFPFDDCVKAAHEAGITAIIQPGGSVRDEDSIKACDEYGIAMVFTGTRHFKH